MAQKRRNQNHKRVSQVDPTCQAELSRQGLCRHLAQLLRAYVGRIGNHRIEGASRKLPRRLQEVALMPLHLDSQLGSALVGNSNRIGVQVIAHQRNADIRHDLRSNPVDRKQKLAIAARWIKDPQNAVGLAFVQLNTELTYNTLSQKCR